MATSDYTELTKCVACDSQDLVETLDLGRQPLANDFLAPGSVLQEFPLKLVRCNDCFHSQLSIAVDPARLFREYSYVSGTSDTLSHYFDGLTNDLISRFGKNKKILDIGSNDGSFLEKFVTSDWLALGVDPAVNLVKESVARGVTTIPAFYDEETADLLATDFDVIVAMNVFAHTQNPLGILKGIQKNLAVNGRAFIQTSQANMFKTGEFDTVYHEHISFFNVRSMKALLQRAGLYLANVSIVPIHGMSYLWEVSKIDNQEVIFERENEEVNIGVYNPEVYQSFAADAFKKAAEVQEIISEYRSKGYKVVSYGAAAKGNTFINFAKLEFDYILDDTPQKISKMSPAGGCVVSNPNILSQIQGPIFVVIPAWNFRSEIIAKIRLNRGVEEDYCLTYFPETLIEKL
jgi:C-methyltransferase C-terminal domain/Methyltransferase domain/Putative zinc binding domain